LIYTFTNASPGIAQIRYRDDLKLSASSIIIPEESSIQTHLTKNNERETNEEGILCALPSLALQLIAEQLCPETQQDIPQV